MKVLVTGAGGFVGKHLIKNLRNRNHEVIAFASTTRVDPEIGELHGLDLTGTAHLQDLLKTQKPDIVFHLAAQSNVMKSWQHPSETLRINTLGTLNLIQSLIEVCPDCRLINVGSSEEYGLSGKEGKPLTEEMACLPQNPYSLSKFTAGQLVLQLAKKHQIQVVHLRPFNHFGPGQEEGFVISDFASQIAKIEKGLIPPVLRVGDLSAQRDFTFIHDIIHAYTLIIENPLPNGIYNICSGIPQAIQTILEQVLRMSKVKIEVATDPNKLRPSEVPYFVGSSKALEQITGWKVESDFLQSLEITLNWWRGRDNY
ncbi:GDP-mannose 4,6-dehydratase [Paenibacillus sp. P26]|nr:GDP-mannose 4,6-dehydratase [Paenibacillus sp. P26]UUZ93031.1 GDP-mannose 4,6-dehydratase [Paenibacillus sp. P25]